MEESGKASNSRPVPNEAPPGLFFTKAAFLKYSALSRVKAARAQRKRSPSDAQALPKPLGPLPGSLLSPRQAKRSSGADAGAGDAAPGQSQDAVVPQIQPTDEGGSEEIASEDIWGDDDADAVMGESARPTAESADPEQATLSPEGKQAKPAAQSGTRKRQAAGAADGATATKHQRRAPNKAVGQAASAGAKPAARASSSKGTAGSKAQRGRRQSKAPADSGAAEPGEAPSELEAARAQFMRSMGLPEPKTFSSASKGSASKGSTKTAQRRQKPAAAPALARPRLGASVLPLPSAGMPQGGATAQKQQAASASPAAAAERPQGDAATEQQARLPVSASPQDAPPGPKPSAAASPAGTLLPSQPAVGTLAAPVRAAPEQADGAAHGSAAPLEGSKQRDISEQLQDAQEDQQMAVSQANADMAWQEEPAEIKQTSSMALDGGALPELPEPEEYATGAAAVPCHAPRQPASGVTSGGPALPKLAKPLGASGRPEENGVKLVNLLNPNNPQYDQAFALEYARMKAAAGKDGGKGNKKKGAKRIYSHLTAKEHAWYLAKQGTQSPFGKPPHAKDAQKMADLTEKLADEQQYFLVEALHIGPNPHRLTLTFMSSLAGLRLHGKDAQRMADLSEKLAEEQQQFIRAQWLDAEDTERFRYMDPRVEAQLQAHFRPQRVAVLQLPQLWRLRGRLQLAAALQGPKQAPTMAHLSTPVASGQPRPFTPPSDHTAVPLHRAYLAPEGSGGQLASLHKDGTALRLAAEKRAAIVMAGCAFGALAQTAVQGFTAGWEIPVTVLPADGSNAGVPQPGRVVIGDPLLKRALSRREKHELLFEHATLALGHDKNLKQQQQQQQAQERDWRKQVLDELQGSAPAEQSHVQQGPPVEPQSAASTLPRAAEKAPTAGPAACSPCDQPALRYSLWRLGEHRIITRAPAHAAVQSIPFGPHSTTAVVQAKIEYHGNKVADAEEVTAEELVRWWSAAHIWPGAHALVWHVGVHSCQVLRSQRFTAQELLESAAASGLQPVTIWRLLAAVLGQLTSLAPGQYLLTHQPGAGAICLFAAAPSEQPAAQADVAPLPCMTDAPLDTLFDLWSAHKQSGATDESQLGFIPKMWQPSFPDVPQIPYTFTPRQPQATPGKRRGRKGTASNTGTAAGQIIDWDTRPTAAGGSGAAFSAANYAELLSEDI